jgi:hypothetical protein
MCDILSDDWNDPFTQEMALFVDIYVPPPEDPHPPLMDPIFMQELDDVLRALKPPMGGYKRKGRSGRKRARGKIVKQ